MKFLTSCILFTVKNKKIDWAMMAAPGETYTFKEIQQRSDKIIDELYVHPVIPPEGTSHAKHVADLCDQIEAHLLHNCISTLPSVFKFTEQNEN